MKRFLFALMVTTLLAGCGAGNDGRQAGSASKSLGIAKQSSKVITITGIIRNEKALIKSGKIEATDNTGKTVAAKHFEDTRRFSLDIPAGTTFPILLTVHPDPNQPKTEVLKAVAISPYSTDKVITPVTTKIADQALALGGYTRENMMKAAMGTVSMPNRDKTVGGFRGDPTKQYGGWH